MKISTFAIAFGPALLVLGAKTVLEPAWLRDFSLAACIGIGAVISVVGAIAARTWETQD